MNALEAEMSITRAKVNATTTKADQCKALKYLTMLRHEHTQESGHYIICRATLNQWDQETVDRVTAAYGKYTNSSAEMYKMYAQNCM